MNCKKKFWKIGLFVIAAIAVMGAIVMGLWNWLMPVLFVGAVGQISYIQALGILILSRILFGGFRGRGGCCAHAGRGSRGPWAHLSDEERQQFKEKMRTRFTTEHSAVEK